MKNTKRLARWLAALVSAAMLFAVCIAAAGCGSSVRISFEVIATLDESLVLEEIVLPETIKAEEGEVITLPEMQAGVVEGQDYVWRDANGTTYAPGDEFTVTETETLTAVYSAATLGLFTSKTDSLDGFGVYGDSTWQLLSGTSTSFGETASSGPWTFDESTMILSLVDETADETVEVDLSDPDDEGLVSATIASQTISFGTMTLTMGGATGYCPAAYILANLNKFYMLDVETGTMQDYTLSFSKDDDVSGTLPDDITYSYMTEIMLPESSLTKENYSFTGWTIDDELYEAGATLDACCGALTATATFQLDVLLESIVFDAYNQGYYDYGYPLTFYVDGTCSVITTDGVAYGTWTVEDGVLTIYNYSGEIVAITVDDDGNTCTYYNTVSYEEGMGNAYDNDCEHIFYLDEFIEAYNAQYGTSITSLSVAEGTAELEYETESSSDSDFDWSSLFG